MNSIIRVATVVNRVHTGNPDLSLGEIKACLEQLKETPADIIILPQLALCGPDCGSLFANRWLREACRTALGQLCMLTQDLDSIIIVGLPSGDGGRVVSGCAVLHRGHLVGTVAAQQSPSPNLEEGCPSGLLPVNTVFGCGQLRFCVLPCDPVALPRYMHLLQGCGAGLVVVPSFSPATAGYLAQAQEALRTASASWGCAVAAVCGGPGASSSPYLYRGFTAVYECGQKLCGDLATENTVSLCDLDNDILCAELVDKDRPALFYHSTTVPPKQTLLRAVSLNPYLRSDDPTPLYDELFEMQALALCQRLRNLGLTRVVVGVSGGMDSTLATLVCARALDMLELPRHHLVGVTMPGFGTTDGTLWSALTLMESLGAESLEIPITPAVIQHFKDISHDPAQRDVVYENAQVRERMQILQDLANKRGGMVVGTTSLSEIALNWSTYGGDQMAFYNVNDCLTKTMIRGMVGHIARTDFFPGLSDILLEILARPVTPELLPPDNQGRIIQRTEEVLGPYEVHEFFLYYFLRYRMRPAKILSYACAAFAGTYTPQELKERLILFIDRFFKGQYKRSSSPDSAILCDVNLSKAAFNLPSDMSPTQLLEELERIEL